MDCYVCCRGSFLYQGHRVHYYVRIEQNVHNNSLKLNNDNNSFPFLHIIVQCLKLSIIDLGDFKGRESCQLDNKYYVVDSLFS